MNAIKGRKKGIVLALILAFLALVVMGTGLYLTVANNDFSMSKRTTYATKAFFLAESGISKALFELRADGGYTGTEGLGPLCTELSPLGEYQVNMGVLDAVTYRREVVSTGYFPAKGAAGAVEKEITVTVSCPASLQAGNFFGNAIMAGGDVSLIGNSTTNGGEILYGADGSISPVGYPNSQPITGDFPMLDFEQLEDIAGGQIKPNGQDNVYTEANLTANPTKPFPTTFWFKDEPHDGIDNDGDGLIDGADASEVLMIPNLVYVKTDLKVNGNIRIGGFYVVAGNVITDNTGANTTMDGKATIDGCVYTLGDFTINGGGNGLGVTGGVWARDDVRLNGNGKAYYNSDFQDGISASWPSLNVKPSIVSGTWRET